jgi:predicted ribosome quality control (RQC) complex YloA/Tae2 family protein
MRGNGDGLYVPPIRESNDASRSGLSADPCATIPFHSRRAPDGFFLHATDSDRMALSATEIELVVKEIAPVLVHGRIQKISQPRDRVLLFEFRVPGATYRLLISCESETARLHLLNRPMHGPPRPPSFCQFLRAQIQGGRLDELRQHEHDRIVTLLISTREGPRTLVCELTGRTTNLLVLDERRHVLRALNQQPRLVGRIYEVPAQGAPGSLGTKAPRFSIQSSTGRFPISRAVEAHYEDKERLLSCTRAKQERLRTLRKALSKMLRRIEAWHEDLTKAAAYREYARYGELLKANLRAITMGMDRITLVDYYDASLPAVTIPLDRTKSALHNMNDYFKKHRKHVAAERELPPRIARADQELDALRREIRSIEEGTWTPPLSSGSGVSPRHAKSGSPSSERRRGPFRRFTSADGLPIFVGRNARENDELTFRLANSDDLWLHARGTPGSHVVVRLAKGADPPLETLQDAATLALLYSDLKKSGKGEVIYTRRKWVKAAKGQAPGAVVVTREHSIHVQLDSRRLEAIKARKEQSPVGF